MITEDFWKSWLAFWFLAGPILLAGASIVFNLYLSRRHLEAMMNAMKNSRYINTWGAVWRRQGWFGGFVLINGIAGIMLWPKVYIRYGEVASLDIENFSPHLKRLLMIYVVSLFVSLFWMAIAFILLKFK